MRDMVGESVRSFGAVLTAALLLATAGGIATAQPDRLDVGPYPTIPGPPLGPAGSPQAGARVEGQRMAGFVVGPWEVDPALTYLYSDSAVVIDGPDALASELPGDLVDVARRHPLIDGFSSYREADARDLRIAVLRFADEQAAAAATADFADVAARRGTPADPVTPVAVPGHPDAAAFGNPADDKNRGRVTFVRAFTAHGPYVFYQLAVSQHGADDAARLVAGTLDRQAPLIDQFVPTPPVLLPTLPVDPTGLLARSVPVPPADASAARPGIYSPRGALHFQGDPDRSAELFADAGVTDWALAAGGVYATRDAQSAQRVVDGFADEAGRFGTPAPAVPGLPGSVCMNLRFEKSDSESSYCLVAADRYAVEADSDSLLDAQQRAAAQYAMLTGR